MAIVSKFVRGSATVDINDGEDGFQLGGQGWLPAVATPVYMGYTPPVTEVMHLRLRQTTHNNIATYMQALHDMQVWAEQYINDPTEDTPVWLHAKLANETGERRALVRGIEIQYGASWYGDEATSLDIPLTIVVEREPYWESITARDLPDVVTSAAACQVYNYTASGASVAAHDIVGDVPARIRFFTLKNTGTSLEHYWAGIRTANKHGATGISNFASVWELEDGTLSTDAATVANAAYSGGGYVRVTESGVDWDDGDFHKVLEISLANISANPEDQFGSYLFIIKSSVSAGTWETRFFLSPSDWVSNYVFSVPVEISATADTFYELGTGTITGRNIHAITDSDFSKSSEGESSLFLYARRTSGTGTFDVDCIVPIPIDEGFFKARVRAGVSVITALGESPEGYMNAIAHSPPTVNIFGYQVLDSVTNFRLPPGDGRIYIVMSGINDVADITDTITANDADVGKYYERWLSLRGSE